MPNAPVFQRVVLSSESADETQQLARFLGEGCTGGETFLLVGTLGTGKTCFTQGLAWGLGVEEYTHSPTFVLVTEYHGRLTLYHVDLYRIESVPEAIELGLEEYLASGGVTAIEWADKALDSLGGAGMVVEILSQGDDRRTITLRALDTHHETLLARLQAQWESRSSQLEGGL